LITSTRATYVPQLVQVQAMEKWKRVIKYCDLITDDCVSTIFVPELYLLFCAVTLFLLSNYIINAQEFMFLVIFINNLLF